MQFARKALELDADRCADSHSLLAEEEATTLDQAIAYYQSAVKAGLRAVVECNREILTDSANKSTDRWSNLPIRPYLRAMAALGCSLFKVGHMEKCVDWLDRYLRLDSDDTLVCRPVWLAAKFYLRDWPAVQVFIDEWKPTGADASAANASVFYALSFARHQLLGGVAAGEDQRLAGWTELALECNIHLAMLLLGKSHISPAHIPLSNTIHVSVNYHFYVFQSNYCSLVICRKVFGFATYFAV